MSRLSVAFLIAGTAGIVLFTSAMTADPVVQDDLLLFVSDREGQQDIYSLTLNEGTISRLTESSRADFDPQWSPDGERIAFTSRRHGGSAIYIMDANGSNPRPVGGDPSGLNYGAHWHPQGTHLVFTSTRANPAGLFVADLDSSETQPFPGVIGYPRHYQWSAEGDRLWVMEADASHRLVELSWPEGERRVLLDEASTPGNLGSFRVSPDERFMAYTAGRGRQLQLHLMNLDDGISHSLENVAGNISHLAWSPDGEWLAYVASATHLGDPARNHLFLLSVQDPEAEPRALAASPADDEWPVWLDGERLVFVSFREGEPRLFLASLAGEEAVKLSSGPGQDGWPVARLVP